MLRLIYRLSMLIGILSLFSGICMLTAVMTVLDWVPFTTQMVEPLVCDEGWEIGEDSHTVGSSVRTDYYCISPTGEEVNANARYMGVFFGLPTGLAVLGALGIGLALLIKRLGGPGFDDSPPTINLSGSA